MQGLGRIEPRMLRQLSAKPKGRTEGPTRSQPHPQTTPQSSYTPLPAAQRRPRARRLQTPMRYDTGTCAGLSQAHTLSLSFNPRIQCTTSHHTQALPCVCRSAATPGAQGHPRAGLIHQERAACRMRTHMYFMEKADGWMQIYCTM